ncbi:MAG: TlpA disulfide reductase family protein [Bacteroidota bacterium]
MKRIILITLCLFLTGVIFAQSNEKKAVKKLPSIVIKTVDGKTINTSDLINNGKPFIITFWATWCKPCQKELTAINEVYDDWQKETGVKIIVVSIDDARSSANVLPLINGKGWTYQFLLDVNSEFKRAMNVNNIPHTFIINGNGEIVWQHTSFSEGSELEVIDLIRKLNKGESISETK